jgi:hypothetical protein
VTNADFPDADSRFLAAVRNQAEARMEMDFQGFLGYFLPEAMAQMRATMGAQGGRPQLPRPGEIERFELMEVRSDGDEGRSAVRYSGYGSFVLKQEWKRTEAGWRVTNMDRPKELATGPSLLQRLKRLPDNFASVRMSRPPGGGPGMGRR